MNLKEARETIRFWNGVPPKDAIERAARWVSVNQSIGFLDCYEQMKPLVEAAMPFEELKGMEIAYDGGHVVVETVRKVDSMVTNLLKALAQWKESKK